jgi:hypothetical protein
MKNTREGVDNDIGSCYTHDVENRTLFGSCILPHPRAKTRDIDKNSVPPFPRKKKTVSNNAKEKNYGSKV